MDTPSGRWDAPATADQGVPRAGRGVPGRHGRPAAGHRRSDASPEGSPPTWRQVRVKRASWATLAVALLLAPLLISGPALAKVAVPSAESSVTAGESIIRAATGTAVITGTVHAPVDPSGTIVAAYEQGDGFIPTARAVVVGTSSTTGTFELPWVPPGTYKLVYIPTRSSGLVMVWSCASSTRTHATSIEVDGGSVVVSDETLQRPATIAGRVTDENGEGVPGVSVGAFPPGHSWVAQSYAVTRPDGTYALDQLAAGDYHVFAMPPELSGFTSTWHPGSTRRSDAGVHAVEPGSFVSGVDVSLVPR